MSQDQLGRLGRPGPEERQVPPDRPVPLERPDVREVLGLLARILLLLDRQVSALQELREQLGLLGRLVRQAQPDPPELEDR